MSSSVAQAGAGEIVLEPGAPSRAYAFARTSGVRATLSTGALSVPNLLFGGGAVEQNGTQNFTIFWAPSDHPVTGAYMTLVNRFLQDAGGSSWASTLTQYTGADGTPMSGNVSLGGTFLDTSVYPASPLTDAQISSEIITVLNATRWPIVEYQTNFFVFTGPNQDLCLAPGQCASNIFCGYHGAFNAIDRLGRRVAIAYGVMPYPSFGGCDTPFSPNGNVAADATINTLSHELAETMTDPIPTTGWTDGTGAGGEIADKCANRFGPTLTTGADLIVNGSPYSVQQEWSNRVSGCAMSLFPPTPTPTATPSPTPTLTPCVRTSPVGVSVVPDGPNRLRVGLTAGTGTLRQIRFGVPGSRPDAPTNALIDIQGSVGLSGSFVAVIPPGTPQLTFWIRKAVAGKPFTVPMVVTDGCNDWQTLAGSGTEDPALPATPTPTPMVVPMAGMAATPTTTFTPTPAATSTPTPAPSTPTPAATSTPTPAAMSTPTPAANSTSAALADTPQITGTATRTPTATPTRVPTSSTPTAGRTAIVTATVSRRH